MIMAQTFQVIRNNLVEKKILLTEKQSRCLQSKVKELILSGGFRSGKTLVMLIKLITQHCTVEKNRILIGRLTYVELRDTVQKDFFALLPPEWIAKWNETRGELTLKNGCEVLFRHLDTVSEMEIRGMNLGCVYISQVEEISFSVYEALVARLSLQHVPCRQILSDCNPLLFWGYKHFKQEADPDRELIEFSMLDNKANLTEDYLKSMLKRPEQWKRQFVFGIWDESLLGDRSVIPVEYIQAQRVFIKEPIRKFNNVKIYKNVEAGHSYQAGFDVSEGLGKDFSAMSVRDQETGEQVAFWKGQIQPDLFASQIAVPTLRYFNTALAVPEINGIGLAFLSRLKDKYENIYKRQGFEKEGEDEKELLGWKTSFSTKPLLIDHYLKLMREGQIQTRAEEVVAEYATFVYNDDTKKKGMGAQGDFHDDAIIADTLACWEIEPKTFNHNVSVPINFDNQIGGGGAGW